MKKRLSEMLPKERFEHSLSVEKTAIDLAKYYGASIEKAALAGLLHDCARRMERADLLKFAEKIGMPIDPIQRFEPKLLHAQLSAYIAKNEFGMTDAEILSAIEHHTTGCENMPLLDKIVYLADHIEPGRDFEGVDRIRHLAFKDADCAIIESASLMIDALIKQGLPIYPLTVATRNYYVLRAVDKNV